MSDFDYEMVAVEWLRYRRQCVLVCLQRDLWWDGVVPDVLGVTKNRMAVEIEIKRTLSDYRANARKRTQRSAAIDPAATSRAGPNYFYFLVGESFREKAIETLGSGAGLMSWGPSGLQVHRPAPKRHTKRISLRDCIRMAKHQAGTLWSLLQTIHNLQNRVRATACVEADQPVYSAHELVR